MNSNLPMIRLLRSPLWRLFGPRLMLLTYTGRKSGKSYTTPVNGIREGSRLTVTSYRPRVWWRNLRGGAPVTVRIAGQDLQGIGEVIEDNAGVAAALSLYLQQAPEYARYYHVTFCPDGKPNPEEVARAARDRVVVRVELFGHDSQPGSIPNYA